MLTELEYAEQLRKQGGPKCAVDKFGTSRKRPLPAGAEKRLRELWAASLSALEIGRCMDCSDSTVWRLARQLGLPRRKPGASFVQWPSQDDAFVLRWYRQRRADRWSKAEKSAAWIARNLPSGRKVTRNAVIGRYGRLMSRKNRDRADLPHIPPTASG